MAPSDARTDERFERVLRHYGGALERLAGAYESEPNERQDLVQDIVFALWRALPAFRGDCSEKTFVFRIAQNRGLTHRWRRERRAARIVELPAVPDAADPATDDAGQDVHETRREVLLAAVRQLPGLQRDVVVLSLEGLSNGEIADVLGISDGTVAVRLTRARASLRNLVRTLTSAGTA